MKNIRNDCIVIYTIVFDLNDSVLKNTLNIIYKNATIGR